MDFLTDAATLGAAVVFVVQQVMKLKVVPLHFANRYPVQTNIALSILVALCMADLKGIAWSWANLPLLAQAVALAAVGAAIAYNQLAEKWVKPYEGSK